MQKLKFRKHENRNKYSKILLISTGLIIIIIIILSIWSIIRSLDALTDKA